MIFGLTRLHIENITESEAKSQFKASFYIWMPYADEQSEDQVQLSVYLYEDIISLQWIKDRWLVSLIEPTKRILVESDAEKLLNAIKNDSADEFPWSPAIFEIQKLKDQYGLK